MTRPRGRPPILAGAIVLALAASACSSNDSPFAAATSTTSAQGDTDASDPTVTESPSAPVNGFEAEFSIVAALAEVPAEHAFDEDGHTDIAIADIDGASAANGTSRPSGPDEEALGQWLVALSASADAAVYPPLPRWYQNALLSFEEDDAEFGFGPHDVERHIEVVAPPQTLGVLIGDIRTISSATADEGIGTFGSGDDLAVDLEQRSGLDQLGRPVRTATIGRRTILSLSTPSVAAWLDPASTRLDADPALALVGSLLDDAEVITAYITRNDFGASLALPPGASPTSGLVPFSTVGLGWSISDAGPLVTVVYAFETATDADTSVGAVGRAFTEADSFVTGQPMSDMVSLVDVVAVDEAVVVTLELASMGTPARRMLDMVFQRDVPFVHG